jgi:iron complex outermembrane receptor protein
MREENNSMNRFFRITAIAVFSALLTPEVWAQHHDPEHEIEEIIVSAPNERTKSDTSMPVNVLSGEELKENARSTLGETLNSLVGVTSASFGPGVGSPVIRGQSGNRVGVLQGGLGTPDASTISQDHANSVEPLLAERIEVIRGPATLLYGNGAIGGIINIIDKRIPESVPGELNAAVELRHNTVSAENTGVFRLDGGRNGLAWHLDGLHRERDDVKIPGLAINEEAEHEEESSKGFIANSAAESASLTAGASFIGERGFIGASIGTLENNYGIPPGIHEHHEEGAEEEEHDAESISIDMKQTRFNIKAGLEMDGFFESLETNIAVNDYKHREIETVAGTEETGTTFNNEGAEARLLLNHRPGGIASGILGLQLGDRKFHAIGEESFIPRSDIRAAGIFAIASIDRGKWLYEFGLRLDNQAVTPAGGCKNEKTTRSGGTSAIWRFHDETNLLISLNRSERAAAVEEYFSNIHTGLCLEAAPEELVVHAPTHRLEIGNPRLNTEIARNLELALRKHSGRIRGELSFFYNSISDYIFLADTGMEVDAIEISRYLQQDAAFSGFEAEITFHHETATAGHIDLTLFSDYVRAELDGGAKLPRIPPLRSGMEIAWLLQSWSVKLRMTAVDDQSRIAENETGTDGYTLVNLYFDYHRGQELTLFIRGNNLLDEEVRNHSSLVKDFAPEPGIGFEAGLRYQF